MEKAARAAVEGMETESAGPKVRLISLMIQGASRTPTNTAPPTVKVWAFFSTILATRLEAGTQNSNITTEAAAVAERGTLMEPSRTNSTATAAAYAFAVSRPYQVRLIPAHWLPSLSTGTAARICHRSLGSTLNPQTR